MGKLKVWSESSDREGAGKHLRFSTRSSFVLVTSSVMARALLEACENEGEGNTGNAKVLAEWYSKTHSDACDARTTSA